MKKIYLLLVVCISLPLSVLASSSDVKVKNGVKLMSAVNNCFG